MSFITLEELLKTNLDNETLDTINVKFQTAVKHRHNLMVDLICNNLKDEYEVKKEYEIAGYTVDVAVFKQDKLEVLIEVTMSQNKQIIEKKEKKYANLEYPAYVIYPTVVPQDIHKYFKFGLITKMQRFCDETLHILRIFKEKVSLTGLFIKPVEEILELLNNTKIMDPIEWSKIDVKKSDLIDDERFNKIDISIDDLTTQIAPILRACMEDPQIQQKFDLIETTDTVFTESGELLKSHRDMTYIDINNPSPSFLFYTPQEITNTFKFKGSTEQELIMQQLGVLSLFDNPFKEIAKNVLEVLEDPLEKNVFNHDVPFKEQEEALLRTEYQEYMTLVHKTNSNLINEFLKLNKFLNHTQQSQALQTFKQDKCVKCQSFIEFCLNKPEYSHVPKPKDLKCKHRKTVKVSLPKDSKCHDFLDKANTSMTTDTYVSDHIEKAENNVKGQNKRYTIRDLASAAELMNVYRNSMIQQKSECVIPEECKRMLYKPGPDNRLFTELKKQHHLEFYDFLKILGGTSMLTCFCTHQNLITQLIHLQNLTYNKGTYSFFNSGVEDVLYIVQHGKYDKGKDVGRAYIIVAFKELTLAERQIFGFVHSFEYDNKKIYLTKWRRISSQRLSFHADQIYSALATTYCTYTRKLRSLRTGFMNYKEMVNETRLVYFTRSIVALSHRQSTAEMLSDYRYLYMCSFSDFSSVQEFVLDKFSKPAKSVFEAELIQSITSFDLTRKEYTAGMIQAKIGEYTNRVRDLDTTGGIINLTSVLHKGCYIRSAQDLFDDMFLYVHTNKEPSSQYHEFVKAYKVIIEFQQIFDKKTKKEKQGSFDSFDEVKNFLLYSEKVGFWDKGTLLASKILSTMLQDPTIPTSIEKTLRADTLLNMNSTKSVIPERERVASQVQYDESTLEFVRNVSSKKRTLIRQLIEQGQEPCAVEVITQSNPEGDKLLVLSGTNRCKVHDSTIDMVKNENLNRTVDLAIWNICENNSRVETDICIKAQYGAKREFYVINHGAKAMARCVEQPYRIICERLPNEMISVPGDKKMYDIQNILDTAILDNKGSKSKISFCNGDCAKWSAAETMECLQVFNMGLNKVTGASVNNFINVVLHSWANKNIYVPKDLNKNLYYEIDEITKYAKLVKFKSTQNFLQGMFNYMSSAKAVACSELTKHLWSALYPESTLKLYHLEHSDDYAFICIAEDQKEFKKLKLLHRIVMRFCGINDSTKKTNCQSFLLEFISLMSFNGVMMYPHIKKVKEVGLNIGCLGFASDIKNTCSRVGEAVRVGIPMEVAYIMGRIQNVRIGQAYGLFTTNRLFVTMNNTMNFTDRPIELWGLPDIYPILYICGKGEPNNYRLWHFGDDMARQMLLKLEMLSKCKKSMSGDELNMEQEDDYCDLYHPNYTYLRNSNVLKSIKKMIEYDHIKANEYFKKHPCDTLLKPYDKDRQLDWLCSKYYMKSFTEAYMRQSRAHLQLRLSRFVSQQCLSLDLHEDRLSQYFKNVPSQEELNKYMRIKDYCSFIVNLELKEDIKETKLMLSKLHNFDDTVKLVYSYLDCAYLDTLGFKDRELKAYKQPVKKNNYSLTNLPAEIIQYIVSPNDFKKDGRAAMNLTTFFKDVGTVENLMIEVSKSCVNKLEQVMYTHGILTASQSTGKPILLSFDPKNNMLAFIKGLIEYHISDSFFYKLNIGLSQYLQPRGNQDFEIELALSENWISKTEYALSDLTLFIYKNRNLEIEALRQIISTFEINDKYSTNAKDYVLTCLEQYEDGTFTKELRYIQYLCVCAEVVLDSPRAINKYIYEKLGYSYSYLKDTPRNGYTTVIINYFGHNYKLVCKETNGKEGHNLTMLTTCKDITSIAIVYQIGLKLINNISLGVMLRRIDTNPLLYVNTVEKPFLFENCVQLYKSKYTNAVTFEPNPTMDEAMPIFLSSQNITENATFKDTIHIKGDFLLNKMSFYSGNAKLFTIAPQQIHQMNAWKTTYVHDDMPCSFWLENSRLEDLYKSGYTKKVGDYLNVQCDLKLNKPRFTELNKLVTHRTRDPEKIRLNEIKYKKELDYYCDRAHFNIERETYYFDEFAEAPSQGNILGTISESELKELDMDVTNITVIPMRKTDELEWLGIRGEGVKSKFEESEWDEILALAQWLYKNVNLVKLYAKSKKSRVLFTNINKDFLLNPLSLHIVLKEKDLDVFKKELTDYYPLENYLEMIEAACDLLNVTFQDSFKDFFESAIKNESVAVGLSDILQSIFSASKKSKDFSEIFDVENEPTKEVEKQEKTDADEKPVSDTFRTLQGVYSKTGCDVICDLDWITKNFHTPAEAAQFIRDTLKSEQTIFKLDNNLVAQDESGELSDNFELLMGVYEDRPTLKKMAELTETSGIADEKLWGQKKPLSVKNVLKKEGLTGLLNSKVDPEILNDAIRTGIIKFKFPIGFSLSSDILNPKKTKEFDESLFDMPSGYEQEIIEEEIDVPYVEEDDDFQDVTYRTGLKKVQDIHIGLIEVNKPKYSMNSKVPMSMRNAEENEKNFWTQTAYYYVFGVKHLRTMDETKKLLLITSLNKLALNCTDNSISQQLIYECMFQNEPFGLSNTRMFDIDDDNALKFHSKKLIGYKITNCDYEWVLKHMKPLSEIDGIVFERSSLNRVKMYIPRNEDELEDIILMGKRKILKEFDSNIPIYKMLDSEIKESEVLYTIFKTL